MDVYEVLKKLNEGSFAEAFLALNKENKSKCVIKVIKMNKLDSYCAQYAKQEVKVLSSLVHNNITKFHDSFEVQGCLCIVMEYCAGGDLKSLIEDRHGIYFSERIILKWFVQLCLAVSFIHQRHILHRDIKTKNIFLTQNGCIKLGDFGIAKILNKMSDLTNTCIGTPSSLSPEMCENKPYGIKSDIWAVGCVLYEMTCLKCAFSANSLKLLILKIIRCIYHPIPSNYSKDLKSLIKQIFQKDPRLRPSIANILRKGFLMKTLQCDSIEICEKKRPFQNYRKQWSLGKERDIRSISTVSYPSTKYSRSSCCKKVQQISIPTKVNPYIKKLASHSVNNKGCQYFLKKDKRYHFKNFKIIKPYSKSRLYIKSSDCTIKFVKLGKSEKLSYEEMSSYRFSDSSGLKHFHNTPTNFVQTCSTNFTNTSNPDPYFVDKREASNCESFPLATRFEYVDKILADIYNGKYIVVQSKDEDIAYSESLNIGHVNIYNKTENFQKNEKCTYRNRMNCSLRGRYQYSNENLSLLTNCGRPSCINDSTDTFNSKNKLRNSLINAWNVLIEDPYLNIPHLKCKKSQNYHCTNYLLPVKKMLYDQLTWSFVDKPLKIKELTICCNCRIFVYDNTQHCDYVNVSANISSLQYTPLNGDCTENSRRSHPISIYKYAVYNNSATVDNIEQNVHTSKLKHSNTFQVSTAASNLDSQLNKNLPAQSSIIGKVIFDNFNAKTPNVSVPHVHISELGISFNFVTFSYITIKTSNKTTRKRFNFLRESVDNVLPFLKSQ